ncbi:carboxylate-amine ligase [Kineosphaera limosa]|uniref:Putative glutamate--cysteine ligase 2 n=1 Tax=Kineosphaera limosa NBRC 100340 TaxID=1184609 RepID=K6VMA0_9MICO|nr:glutamate--cysteine ligase [Kineosphaera limosa]NYE01603.1 carboxylate-amine ligase [Kineosphaera limosa]GAB97323.1 carboxylate-amine ligase [Kineosphaera limosa NBRC 100340]
MSASPDPQRPPGLLQFSPSEGRTVGVEWEIGLVDPASLDLVPKAQELLALVQERDDSHWHSGASRSMVTKELLTNTVEIVTGICANAPEAAEDLADGLARVRAAADQVGVDLFGGGSHPFARWEDQHVTDGDRYETLIDRTQWWGRQMLIFGVHVHVGIRSAAKVWPLINALLTYHPHLTALTASSPYWTGADTGYASNRTMLFQQLPTAGLPFRFETWAAYRGYLRDVFTTGVVEEASELRWDIRPSLQLGTIEVRCSDGLTSLDEMAALTAFIHCLTLYLEAQLDDGSLPRPLPPWHVQENKWRAARYGLEAIVIVDAQSREVLVTDHLSELLERLTPTARRLGCERELAGIERIVARGAGYQRMRAAVAAGNGDIREAARAMLIR